MSLNSSQSRGSKQRYLFKAKKRKESFPGEMSNDAVVEPAGRREAHGNNNLMSVIIVRRNALRRGTNARCVVVCVCRSKMFHSVSFLSGFLNECLFGNGAKTSRVNMR